MSRANDEGVVIDLALHIDFICGCLLLAVFSGLDRASCSGAGVMEEEFYSHCALLTCSSPLFCLACCFWSCAHAC
jgi:hypothetical protein